MELLSKMYILAIGTISSITPYNTININNKINFSETINQKTLVDMNFNKNLLNNVDEKELSTKNDIVKLQDGIQDESFYLKDNYLNIPYGSDLNNFTMSFLLNWGGTDKSFVPINIDKNIKLICKDGTLCFDYGDKYTYNTSSKITPNRTYFVTISVDKNNKLNSEIYINGIKQNLYVKKDSELNIKNDDNFTLGSKYNDINDNTMIDDLKIFNTTLSQDDILNLYYYVRTPSFSIKKDENKVSLDWRSYVGNFNNSINQNRKNDLYLQDRSFLNLQLFSNPIVNIFRNDVLVYQGYNTHFEDVSAKDTSNPTNLKNVKVDVGNNEITFDKSALPGTMYTYKMQLPNSNVEKDKKDVYLNSGLKGYSYAINQEEKADLSNDINLDKGATKVSIPKLADGEYYFHIKAIGNNGNTSDTYTIKFAYEDSKPKIDNFYSYKKDNNTIDLSFKVSDNIGIDKVYIKAYRSGNENSSLKDNKYGGYYYKEIPIKETEKKNTNTNTNTIKESIKISDIGGGSDYVNVEVGAINKGQKTNSYTKNIKVDDKAPNINIQCDKNIYSPKSKDFAMYDNIKVKLTDNFNSMKKIVLKYDDIVIEEDDIHLNPKILLIESEDKDIEKALKNDNYSVDVKSINNISENDISNYDVIMFKDNKNAINDNVAKLLNTAYDNGARIITIDNNSTNNIHPIKSYSEGSGQSKYYQYFDIKDEKNNPLDYDHLFECMNNLDDNSERKTFITEIPKDTRPLLYDGQGVSTLGVNNSKYIDATYSQNDSNGKWIHYNIPNIEGNLLRRTIDEVVQGDKKKQEYNMAYKLNKNGKYSIEVTDFAGNKSEREFEIKNIDNDNPVININYPEDKNNDDKYYKYEDLKISTKDEKSGVDKIALPNGNFTKINNIKYRVSKNDKYKFNVTDMLGNIYERIIPVRLIDNKPPEISLISDVKGDTWVNKDVVIKMTGKDDIDKSIKLEYKINDNYWQTYTSPIVLSENGTYKISFRGLDDANNISNIINNTYNIDKESPKNNDISVIVK